MKYLGALILMLILSINARANDFNHFSIDEDRLENLYPKKQKKSGVPKGLVAPQSILNSSGGELPDQFEFEKSPMYEQVMDFMEMYHEGIGKELSGNVLTRSQDFNLGTKNTSGFTWQKPIGVISVIADRQVTPSQTSNLWEVQDQLVLSVNAETFIQSLADQGAVDIDAIQLRAFAGLSFNRKYTYKHYARSYEDGVKANYGKLFLSPAIFHGALYQMIFPGESLSKQDFFSFHAGGGIRVPLQYGLELSAAILGGIEKISQVEMEVEKLLVDNRDEYSFALRFNKQSKTFFGVQLSLSLDFLQLLKLSLLKFEYQYDHIKSATTVYRIPIFDLLQFDLGGPEHQALLKAVNLNENDEFLMTNYLHHQERASKETHSYGFSFLFWGSEGESSEEELYLKSPDHERYYFKHSAFESNHAKSFGGAISGVLSLAVLGFDSYRGYNRREFHEYEFAYDKEDAYEQQQTQIAHQYYVKKTTGWGGRGYKKRIINGLKKTGFSKQEVYDDIDDKKIKAPIQVDVRYLMGMEALGHLVNLEEGAAESAFAQVCGEEDFSSYREDDYYYGYSNSCVDQYMDRLEDMQKGGQKGIKAYNKLVKKLYKEEASLQDLRMVFGDENVSGLIQIKARTYDDQPYTYFEGEGIVVDPIYYNVD